jgi:hypothetical protein
MKIYVPVRGFEYVQDIPACDAEFDRFVEETGSIKNDPLLIRMLDEDHHNVWDMKKITFSVTEGDEHPEITAISQKHPEFNIMYVYTFLVIDIMALPGRKGSLTHVPAAEKYLRRLSVLLNLTYATPISFLSAAVFDGSKYLGITGDCGGSFDQAYMSMASLGWPKIPKLQLKQVLNWIDSCNIRFFGTSSTPAARAFNAYSYLFSYQLPETDPLLIFWCMHGLQALYTKGNRNISEQLHHKLILAFGEPPEFGDKLAKLYENHARMVHGRTDIPAKYSRDIQKPAPEYRSDLGLASSILIASLRILISRNVFQFDLK